MPKQANIRAVDERASSLKGTKFFHAFSLTM
nr:MAG TPA: hypothetical protein [Caudoviricetes sp.]